MITADNLDDDQKGLKLVQWLHKVTIDGGGFLPSAVDFSNSQRSKSTTDEEAINAMIRWRTVYAAGCGFVTGVGGIAALPVTIPASIAASYALSANLVAAIAHRRGYDPEAEEVRTMILCCLLGEAGKDLLKKTVTQIGQKSFQKAIYKIPRHILLSINRTVGYRLIAKTGEKSVISLTKLVPILGGIIGGTFDGVYINTCGQIAKDMFPVKQS